MALCVTEIELAERRLAAITNPVLKLAELRSQLERTIVIEEDLEKAMARLKDRKRLLLNEIDAIISEINKGGENDNVGIT